MHGSVYIKCKCVQLCVYIMYMHMYVCMLDYVHVCICMYVRVCIVYGTGVNLYVCIFGYV